MVLPNKQRKNPAPATAELAPGGVIELSGGSLQFVEAAAEENGQKLQGFDYTAYTGVPIQVEAFYYPAIVDLAGLKIQRQDLPVRMIHQRNVGVGHTVTAQIADGIVKGRAVVSRTETAEAKDFVSSAQNGFPWQVSIGASIERVEFLKPGATDTVNGRGVAGPMNIVRESTLNEVSICDLGADKNTSTKLAARYHGGGSDMKTFEEWLKARGLEAASDEEKKTLRRVWEAEVKLEAGSGGGTPGTDGTDGGSEGKRFASIDAVVAEGKRVQGIEELGVKYAAANLDKADEVQEVCAKAVRDKLTLTQTELELTRIARPQAPGIQERKSVPPSGAVLEAAACMSAGISGDDLIKKHRVRQEVVEAADERFRYIGLQELILIAARANGYRGRERITVGNWREVLAYAAPELRAAGVSTISLPGILGNVANKAMAAEADQPEYIAPRIAGRANHPNFHTHTVYSLALSGDLEEVAPSGELKHLKLTEESYTRKVKTRGAVLGLSREDAVNDDMGAFTTNSKRLAIKSFTSREKALFKVVNATGTGASHFTVAHKNYLSGTAFGSEGMGLAVKAFEDQTGPDGDPIMVTPTIVLVSTTNAEAARQLLKPSGTLIVTGLSSTSAKSVQANSNIYAGEYGGAPLVSQWLGNSKLPGYSTTAWYLLADPNRYPCFEIAYLNGNDMPTVEYFGLDAQADLLGMIWRVYFDFGVGTAEWRAGVKSAGG